MAKLNSKITREDVKSNLDELFSNVENFRETGSFQQMLDFVARFKSVSPYNAFLLYQQRPGVKYVLNASQWAKRHERKIKPNARPLIVLVPFGPVDYVYDISDTYAESNPYTPSLFEETDDDFLASVIEPYKTYGYEPKSEMAKLVDSMKYHGITVDTNFKVGNSFAGQIEILDKDYHPKMQSLYKDIQITITANYLLSIRDKAKCGEAFATAVHELGHFFCHHLIAIPAKAWQVRYLDHITKEFEAEAVSYIVCERLGIKSPAANYLNGYYERNNTIPDISVETIFTACNMILNMIDGIKLKQSILYKYDERFKSYIDAFK